MDFRQLLYDQYVSYCKKGEAIPPLQNYTEFLERLLQLSITNDPQSTIRKLLSIDKNLYEEENMFNKDGSCKHVYKYVKLSGNYFCPTCKLTLDTHD